MAVVLQLCTSLGLLQPGSTLCEGVYSTSCHCVLQQQQLQVCCAGPTTPDDVVRLLSEELSHQPTISRLQISMTEWGDEFPSDLFSATRPTVRELVLDHNGISELPAAVFSGLRGTRILWLNHNRLTAVPVAALRLLPQLRTLVVNNNRIVRLARDQLASLALLRHLSLAENRLAVLEPGALPAGIRQLSLYDNRLESLNGTLRNLGSMNWLFLAKNRLTSLRGQLPVGHGLDLLTVSENRLTSLDGVQDAVSLSRLFLNSNQLTSLERLRLPRLRVLEVSYNLIEKATAEQFVGMPALEEVILASNRLTELGPILDVLLSLAKLDLSDNMLTSISSLTSVGRQNNRSESDDFSHPLKQLYLSANRLTSVGELHLPGLRVLDLSDNRLTEVSAHNFAGLPSLSELVLSGNHLEEVGLLLEVLPSLTKADLSDNILRSVTPLRKQEEIPHKDKPQLLHLEKLLLNNNSLSSLHVSLHRLPSLCVLDVRDNAISRLQWDLYDAWHCRLQRRKLRLEGNPVSCDDEEVRRSLLWAAQHFSVDVQPCADLSAE